MIANLKAVIPSSLDNTIRDDKQKSVATLSPAQRILPMGIYSTPRSKIHHTGKCPSLPTSKNNSISLSTQRASPKSQTQVKYISNRNTPSGVAPKWSPIKL